MIRLAPHLMFQGQMQAALDHWRGAFPDMVIKPLMQEGETPTLVEVTIAGQTMTVFNSPPVHDFTFTPSMSLMVTCDAAGDVDRIFEHLAADGAVLMPLDSYDFAPRFGWVNDRFGVSWQIRQGG